MNNYDLILHHYEMSPFSQKIRSMFGYCRINWYSVLSPPMPPRPNLDPLTGGYRKIPVLQIGADLFCDTRVISAEIAKLSGNPLLDRDNCAAEVQAYVDDVD
ncbi:MAG: glutathione S-transferase N-terminal domain-containing protein, partial [Arenicella sp.]|nr:glutathione S-transferase N-terminal domain-containing protein [Arenicella sp.]